MKNHSIFKKNLIWEKMKGWKGILFHLAGIIAIIWFLIRVLPKPQRVQYPCQQVAISISLGYIAFWSILLTGLVVWLKNAKTKFAKTVPTFITGFIVVFTITGAVLATNYLMPGVVARLLADIPASAPAAEAAPGEMRARFTKRGRPHLLSVAQFDRETVESLLRVAEAMEPVARRRKVTRVLEGAVLGNPSASPARARA